MADPAGPIQSMGRLQQDIQRVFYQQGSPIVVYRSAPSHHQSVDPWSESKYCSSREGDCITATTPRSTRRILRET